MQFNLTLIASGVVARLLEATMNSYSIATQAVEVG